MLRGRAPPARGLLFSLLVTASLVAGCSGPSASPVPTAVHFGSFIRGYSGCNATMEERAVYNQSELDAFWARHVSCPYMAPPVADFAGRVGYGIAASTEGCTVMAPRVIEALWEPGGLHVRYVRQPSDAIPRCSTEASWGYEMGTIDWNGTAPPLLRFEDVSLA